MPKPPFNISGAVPEEHGLDAIQRHLYNHPRDRVFAVVELVNASDARVHPLDEPSYPTITIRIVDLEPVVVPDDVNTIREVRDRARLNRPGRQPTLEDGAADELDARRRAGETGGRA